MNDLPESPPVVDESLVGRIADEFTERLNRGENPDVEKYSQRYPELADVLRQALPALQAIRHFSSGLTPSGEPGVLAPGDAPPRELGDFRILREVGRGGMGIVYEAEQMSLGRRVALKVLPFAGAMDPRHLQRFRNEAHAAAQLHQTNIVPVYSVGCERGVHFYAMQYIEGHSLAEVIAELRGQAGDAATKPQPSPSPQVEATVDAPAGQLIAPDSGASAVRQTHPIAALSTIRSTKDRAYFRAVAELGIQAAEALDFAHEHGVIHRDVKPANLLVDAEARLWITDFGLAQVQGDARMTMTGDLVGTLRYMSPEQALAKRVVVDHRTDVYSLGATLYELLTLEPAFAGTDRQELLRQIAFEEARAPRRQNRAIPTELEIIVLKALEKNPADRYATAKELADDLERYVKDEPIRARRPTLALQARKWFRRHPAVLRSAVAMLILAVVSLALGSYLIWREKGEKEAALDLAKTRREAAESAQQRTRAVLDDMSSEVIDDWLGKQNELTPEQRKFLERALAHYEDFTRETGDTPQQRALLASAHGRVGIIRYNLGLHAASEDAYRRALDLWTQLVADFPSDAHFRRGLAASHYNRGLLLGRLGRRDDALAAFRASLKLELQLAEESATDTSCRMKLADTHSQLGLYTQEHNPQEAEQNHRKAIGLLENLVEDKPDSPDFHQSLGGALHNLALLVRGQDRLSEARRLLERAVSHQDLAVKADPRNIRYLEYRRNHYIELASTLARLSEFQEAEKVFGQARDRAQELAAAHPAWPDYRYALALVHAKFGEMLLESRQPEKAEKELRWGRSLLESIVEECPEVPQYGLELVITCNKLAKFLVQQGRLQESSKILREGLKKARELTAAWRQDGTHRYDLGRLLSDLGYGLKQTGDLPGATETIREAMAMLEKSVADSPNVPERALALAVSYGNFGGVLGDGGQLEAALEWYGKALDLLQAMTGNKLPIAQYRQHLRNTHGSRAMALDKLKRYVEAVNDWDRAVELDDERVARIHLGRALSLAHAGKYSRAVIGAKELSEWPAAPADVLYGIACVYSICSGNHDASQPTAKSSHVLEPYGLRAIELLRRAVEKGWKDAARIMNDPDLDPLRQREDFQKLLHELEAIAPADGK
jgi:serine/threonine protein kinase